jgi:hypothetical protein
MRAPVEKAVRAELKDPDSGRFGPMVAFKTPLGSAFVCSLVNAKNSFSVYVGHVPFYIDDSSVPKVEISDAEGEGRAMFTEQYPACVELAR